MIQSREFALRCAAAIDKNLLRHNWPRDENKRIHYGVTETRYKHSGVAIISQLDGCQSDEARRLILGKSK